MGTQVRQKVGKTQVLQGEVQVEGMHRLPAREWAEMQVRQVVPFGEHVAQGGVQAGQVPALNQWPETQVMQVAAVEQVEQGATQRGQALAARYLPVGQAVQLVAVVAHSRQGAEQSEQRLTLK